MNVVLNFHYGDQESARLLLNLLMCMDEGTDCNYYLQYGDNVASLNIGDTIFKFCNEKKVKFSNELPVVNIPEHIIENDPNILDYKKNHTNRSKGQKQKHLQWNLCVYKYLNLLDNFLMLEPDSVILQDKWLKNIEGGFRESNAPIYGHLKYGKINGEMVPTHWAGSSVYNSKLLNELSLDKYFSTRIDNPWWNLRNLPNTVTSNNCFWGPYFSGYDISYDFFLFALYWIKNSGSKNPYDWKEAEKYNGIKNIVCDFNSDLTSDEIITRYYKKISLFHGAKGDEVRMAMNCLVANKETNKSIYSLGCPKKTIKEISGIVSLRQLKNRFKGEKCFIIGNGPSIKKTDLSLLKREYTFGLNRIYLNYENMGFEPTFYCAVNSNVIDQFHADIDKLNSIKFISSIAEGKLTNLWNTFLVKSLVPRDTPGTLKTIKNDISNGIHSTWDKRHFNLNFETCSWHEGWTVTYCALQVAYYMGFSTIFLVGVDHKFVSSGIPNKSTVAIGEDDNHFHPDYFSNGTIWQFPDLQRSEESFKIAKRVFERDGRKIFDATIDGHLNIFPKIDYSKIPYSTWNTVTQNQINIKDILAKYFK
jgi:hypothetical protein